ncbi:MAG: hypothetical protein K2Y37_19585 [Pirellulales bacterium]|nr:hypothetical protein [Pirellulales bacterium]
MHFSRLVHIAVSVAALAVSSQAFGEHARPVAWHDDYSAAIKSAKEQGKMLLVHFYDPKRMDLVEQFGEHSLNKPEVQRRLMRFERVRVPLDTKIVVDGHEQTVLERPGYREMLGRAGIAIVDFKHPGSRHYRQVVSTFPFPEGRYYGPRTMYNVLTLPAGTLTQRTIIFAVRQHPEAPASTRGLLHPVLSHEAESHSRHQATIHVQGHHSWETRFHRINARVGEGALATEVVAESWPGENLVEAAVECVRSWRQSPGHWNAVRSRHRFFAFDMKRGSNGIWYATGLFANRRR